MDKTFSYDEVIKCPLCKKDIFTLKDKWTAVIDCEKEETTSKKIYHTVCLKDLIQGKGEVIKQNFQDKLKAFTKNLFGGGNNLYQQYDFDNLMK